MFMYKYTVSVTDMWVVLGQLKHQKNVSPLILFLLIYLVNKIYILISVLGCTLYFLSSQNFRFFVLKVCDFIWNDANFLQKKIDLRLSH